MSKKEANIIFTNTLLKVQCLNCGHIIPSVRLGHIEPDYKNPSKKETVIVNGKKVKIGAVEETIVVSPECCPKCEGRFNSIVTRRYLSGPEVKKTKYYIGIVDGEKIGESL